MDWSFRNKWSEFDWEREIRKDELRIASYFKTLGTCLDLPGEEEMIFKRLMSQPDLVPTGVANPESLTNPFEQLSEEEAAEEWDETLHKRGNFEGLRRLEKLSSEWNLLVAHQMPESSFLAALNVTCHFGKLLSRITNFVDVEDVVENRSLRISLLKRSLADLNELIASLENVKAQSGLPEAVFAQFFEKLSFFRESVLDWLGKVRK